MAFVEWKDALNVGVSEVDEQHQSLVAMLNRLHDTVQAGANGAELPVIVSELKNYALMHFSTEEKLMKKAAYPDMFNHMTQHAYFVAKVKDFTAATPDEAALLPAICEFLKTWLVEHISNVDVKMGRFLASQA